jgi:hypothetical protein
MVWGQTVMWRVFQWLCLSIQCHTDGRMKPECALKGTHFYSCGVERIHAVCELWQNTSVSSVPQVFFFSQPALRHAVLEVSEALILYGGMR